MIQGEIEQLRVGDARLAIETDESQYSLMVVEAVHVAPSRFLREI